MIGRREESGMTCSVVDGYVIYMTGNYPRIVVTLGYRQIVRNVSRLGELVISIPTSLVPEGQFPHYHLQFRTLNLEQEANYIPQEAETLEESMELITTCFKKWTQDAAVQDRSLEQQH